MFFNSDENDEEEFGMAKSSNLSGIFENMEGYEDRQNTSLKYSAPKQPKKTAASESKQDGKASSQLAVIHTSLVNAFKLEDGKYNSIGRLGLAILGNYESHNFLLLLYKDKKNTVAKAIINLHFTYTVQENNYATFYDNKRLNWSVNFENLQLCQNFAIQIGLAKFHSIDSNLESPIIQDLSVGAGTPVLLGETVYVTYTCWILSDRKLGQVFFSNHNDSDKLSSVKVGESGLITGFDTGILNMKRGGHRILILQPSVDINVDRQCEFKIPENVTVVLRVEIGTGPNLQSSHLQDKPSVSAKPTFNNSSDDSSVKARCVSISEQLHSSPKTDKAKLISRMAKMGQPTVPVQSTIPIKPSNSESEAEEDRNSPADPKLISNSQMKSTNSVRNQEHFQESNFTPVPSAFTSFPSTNTANVIPSSLALCQPQQMMPNQQLLPIAPTNAPFVFLPANSSIDSQVPVLFSEVRTQNTEVRMQMAHVSEKVDRVLDKIGQTAVYPNMEVGILSENINRIFQQNESFKKLVSEKDAKIQMLSEKVNDLLQSNQRVLEKSNIMLEQRSDRLHSTSADSLTRITSLEQEKNKLIEEMTATLKTVGDLQNKLLSYEKSDAELRESLARFRDVETAKQNVEDNYESLKTERDTLRNDLTSTEGKLRLEESKCQNLQEQLNQRSKDHELIKCMEMDNAKLAHENMKLISEIKTLKDQEGNNSAKPESTHGSPVEEIKKVMNAVYRNLQKEFALDRDYSGNIIKSTMASTIRKITLEVIEHYSDETPIAEAKVTIDKADLDSKLTSHKEVITEESSTSTNPMPDFAQEEIKKVSGEADKQDEITLSTKDLVTESKTSVEVSTLKEIDEPWRPQPPPFFDDGSEGEDDWLK